MDDVKRGPAHTMDDLATLQESLIKKFPKMKDLTKKKNIQELYPFHVISHDVS